MLKYNPKRFFFSCNHMLELRLILNYIVMHIQSCLGVEPNFVVLCRYHIVTRFVATYHIAYFFAPWDAYLFIFCHTNYLRSIFYHRVGMLGSPIMCIVFVINPASVHQPIIVIIHKIF
jgi:hypothetical protein